ncbi:MAG: TetR/AcrR family transcriptional regulator [Myxococcales bacterium]|nr:TetR/AcrR family transcriptional regulator [Myxococcales bacterium]
MDTRAEDKRRRILAAATVLFSRYGFKRTSIDLLAREADVAKPTVYVYFEDKEAIFRAVVEAVCAELLAAATAAAEADEPLEARLTGMLSAKFTRYFELVNASPHAEELVDSQGRLGAEIVERADRAFVRLLVSTLERAKELDPRRLGLSLPATAALLIRAASGAAYDATNAATHRKHLAEIVRVVVAGLRPRP